MRKNVTVLLLLLGSIGIVSAAMFSWITQKNVLAANTFSEIESNSLLSAISEWKTIPGQCNPGIEATRVVFYCNESGREQVSTSLPYAGTYRVTIRGASSNGNPAGITVKIDTSQIGTATFTSTQYSGISLNYTATSISAARKITFVLTTDTGISDTIIDGYSIEYLGAAPTAPPVPTLAASGSVLSGGYRNLFSETGYSPPDIDKKLQDSWNALFYGDPNTQAVYRPVGTDMAFIEDTGNSDIRSEGMSYGMMIAVQMNKRDEFDRLWRFAKTYMECPRATQCPVGSGKEGYFSWQLDAFAPYRARDEGPAPDGEAYFATALIFAGNRWGNAGGHNYHTDAQKLLNAMRNDNRPNGMRSMFDPTTKYIVFAPIGDAALKTDPSYHLPAFFEVWARFDTTSDGRTFWQQAAQQSRAYWQTVLSKTPRPETGLLPDCTDLTGTPIYGCAGGAVFAYDSWRTIANIAVDHAWWGTNPWAIEYVNRFQTFFGTKRPAYANRWNLDGTPIGADMNSPGHVAMNGTGSLIGNNEFVYPLAQDVWNLPIPSGKYRYYDGMLYTMALLHLSGNFRAYLAPQQMVTTAPVVTTATPSIVPTVPLTTAPSPTITRAPTITPSRIPTAILKTATPTRIPSATITKPPTPTLTQAAGVQSYFLSTLSWTGTSNGLGPVERDRSNGGSSAGDGKALLLRGVTYSKGLGTYAYSSINYHLKGKCTLFSSVIGVDDSASTAGTVQFDVYADGNRVYRSPVVKGGGQTYTVNLALANPQYLELRVTDAGDGNKSDYADWVNARVWCSSAP